VTGSAPRIAVVMVNWRGTKDTIECLESLLRSDVAVHAIVCDNDSGDGSVEALLDWARGEPAYEAPSGSLAPLTIPPLEKPLVYEHLRDEGAFTRGPQAPLTIIETGGNLGYARGNNVGIRFALANPDIDVVWLLNNDTVVEPSTAGAILAAFDTDPGLGMVGAALRYYHRPSHHQMLGGMRFSRWTTRAVGIGAGSAVGARVDADQIGRETDFVCGASLGVSRAFLETVGLMGEEYFLYYEEVDWAIRNAGRFRMGFSPAAIVYHKEGGSIGSSGAKGQRSALSDYHHARSKLLFGRKHYPALLPAYFAQNLIMAARRILRRQPDKARAILRASIGLPFSPPASGR
jgi:GT2 family glycosyltransferase